MINKNFQIKLRIIKILILIYSKKVLLKVRVHKKIKSINNSNNNNNNKLKYIMLISILMAKK